MVKQAQSSTQQKNVTFREAFAEDMSFIEDGTLDLVVAGQAAHWFDFSKVWPLLRQKLRTGGTIAFWGYKDNVFVDYPKATKVLDHYCYGLEKDLMGSYWEQPGRQILRDKYKDILPPEDIFEDVERIEYEPGTDGANTGIGDRLMSKKLNLGEMEGYARTFSSYHGWQEAHPEQKSRALGGQGDVVDEMFDEMLKLEPEWQANGENWRDFMVESEWGSAVLLARKK